MSYLDPVYNSFSTLYCIWFANIMLRLLASKFMRNIGLYFSSSVMSLSDFGIRVMLVMLVKWFSKNFLYYYILEEIIDNWYKLFLDYFIEFTCEPVLDFLIWNIIIIDSVHLIDKYLFGLYFFLHAIFKLFYCGKNT